MAFRMVLLRALLAGLALAPTAAACTVEPPVVCTVDLEAAQVCAQGPCPPATNGGVYVRVLDQAFTIPFPG